MKNERKRKKKLCYWKHAAIACVNWHGKPKFGTELNPEKYDNKWL